MFTALSVYRGSAFYCDGWSGKRAERWPLPPRHLAMNSEQLDRQWGNYTIIITRTCAQAYLFAHYINTVLYTPDGVPNVFSLMTPSLPSSVHLSSTIFFSQFPSLCQLGNSSLPGKLASSGPQSVSANICVCVCERARERERHRLFALYVHICAVHLGMLILTINNW